MSQAKQKKVLRRPKLRPPQHLAGQGSWAARGNLAHGRVDFHPRGYHRVGLPRVPRHRLTAGGAHRRRTGALPHRGFYPHCVCHNGGPGRFLYHQGQLARGRIGVFQDGDRHRGFPLVQRFLWLLIATVGAAIIAWLRWARYRKTAKRTAEMETASRRADADQDRRNREERLSVADLMARDKPAKNSKQSQVAPQRARASHTLKKSRPAPKDRLRGRDREERRRMQQEERNNPLRPDPARRAGDSVPASQKE